MILVRLNEHLHPFLNDEERSETIRCLVRDRAKFPYHVMDVPDGMDITKMVTAGWARVPESMT